MKNTTPTEKQKMLAGELYNPWDKEIYSERLQCRKVLQQLNNSIPESEEWRSAILTLIPNAENTYLEPPFHCDYGWNIKVGKNFYANFNCTILDGCGVNIGNDVMFGPGVQIFTIGHTLDVKRRVDEGVEYGKPITIGNNVWLGGGTIVCPGITIGDNTVIGAGSVITRDIPSNVMAAGNPCRVIKTL